jgi:hypothetical protein
MLCTVRHRLGSDLLEIEIVADSSNHNETCPRLTAAMTHASTLTARVVALNRGDEVAGAGPRYVVALATAGCSMGKWRLPPWLSSVVAIEKTASSRRSVSDQPVPRHSSGEEIDLLVAEGDGQSMAEAVQRLITDPELGRWLAAQAEREA